MEFNISSEDLKDDSPSQECIGSTQMKLDLESVDDFEHIMKEVSPSKEATAQFLQHETTYATNQNRDKARYDIDEVSKSSEVTDEDDSQSAKPTVTWQDNPPEFNAPAQASTDLILAETPNQGLGDGDDSENASSKNFKQYDRDNDKEEDKLPSFHVESQKDTNLTKPDTTYEQMKGGDFNFNDNSDIVMLDSSSTKNNTPAVTSYSLPGIMRNENESEIVSEKTPQGDGLHLKQVAGSDVSDNEEHIPEPLPKDYPEIGVLEPNVFLSAIGIERIKNLPCIMYLIECHLIIPA
ncbi:UNVERIFIED_CONTAM: hypothetical protein PYX00_009024 [Menopon gallinae]|uniref:Uncharacterized protein n=1 Tax=Menopon gallinae TaxID=328185 RepID=A0AAW2H9R5_9NEOP